MEEQKEKKAETKAIQGNKEERKLTYEELNNACMQLEQQNQYLIRELQKANLTNMFRRLDYLFKVIEFARSFDDAAFVYDCIKEIKEAMTINPEEDKEEA